MSEAGIEVDEADRQEQLQGMDPDPGVAEEIRPEASPITPDQVAAGRDAEPVDEAEQGRAHRFAEDSHEEGGPGDQQAG